MNYQTQLSQYIQSDTTYPLFLCGDALNILKDLPEASVDFCMTSPPYWNKREYQNGGIGLEIDYQQYIDNLLAVFSEVRRILKPTGSFWLNLGDTYQDKGMVGIPWRIALRLVDEQKWILRNDIIWNKLKGPDNSKDKLRNVHEYIFHFVKRSQGFYYDVDSIRTRPREAQIRNGAIVSATGVTGVRYQRQIELSTSLNPDEKVAAMQTLTETLEKVARGELSDFRMVIRNQQRTTHSNSEKLSGRAKELMQKGFYILKYHPKGSKPGDVWDIIPEDSSKRDDGHYAAYPVDICRIPILATCPSNGIVVDPFCGTGTTNLIASKLNRKSVGIDISSDYIDYAIRRCGVFNVE